MLLIQKSKLIKNCINKHEHRLIRVANAFDCYDRLSKDLTQTQPDPKWQTHIDNQSESMTVNADRW